MENKKGIGFGGIVTIILLIAKILGMEISWVAVFAPVVITTFGTAILLGIAMLGGLICYGIVDILGKIKISYYNRKLKKQKAARKAEMAAKKKDEIEYREKAERYLREQGLEGEGWVY